MLATCLCLCWLASSLAAAQDDPLARARDLYEAAAFDRALATLKGVTSNDPTRLSALHRYRALSLVALRRDAEARSAVEAMIAADPMAPAALGLVPPRFRAMVIAAWRPVMRGMIREQYTRGKLAYGSGASADAVSAFTFVIAAIHHPDLAFQQDPFLADFAHLASEYLELSRASITAQAHSCSPVTSAGGVCD